MMALLVEAGEPWFLNFERVARIATTETLRPYAFEVPELDGLLFAPEGFLPVWRPAEFAAGGGVVVLFYGNDGLAGLRVTQVLGVREVDEGAAHADWLMTADGRRGRWFDVDVLEGRLS